MISYKHEISQLYIRPKAPKPEAGIRALRALPIQGAEASDSGFWGIKMDHSIIPKNS